MPQTPASVGDAAHSRAGYVGLLETLMAATRPAPVIVPLEVNQKTVKSKAELDHFTRLLIDTIQRCDGPEQKLRLAQLGDAPWLPEAARLELCTLPVSVSQSMLQNPRLSDAALFNILHNRSEEHQIAIAGRADLSNNLVKAIINLPPFAVHLALLNNPTARMEPEDMQALCQLAQTNSALRGALVRHAQFSEDHAKALMASVGPDLREALSERFALQADAPSINSAQKSSLAAISELNLSALTNGLLLNLLQGGQYDVFLQGVARKLDLEAAKLRHSLNGQSCIALALAMTALGIDRAVFGDVLSQIQRLNQQRPKVTSAHHLLARPVFDLPPDMAKQKLTAILG